MPQRCAVKACGHSYKFCNLHAFPTETSRRTLWELKVRENNGQNWCAKDHHRLCECHFVGKQLFATKTRRPDVTAVPTIFPRVASSLAPLTPRLIKPQPPVAASISKQTIGVALPLSVQLQAAPLPSSLASTSRAGTLKQLLPIPPGNQALRTTVVPKSPPPRPPPRALKTILPTPVISVLPPTHSGNTQLVIPSQSTSLDQQVSTPMGFLIPIKVPLANLQCNAAPSAVIIDVGSGSTSDKVETSTEGSSEDIYCSIMKEEDVVSDDDSPPLYDLCRVCAESKRCGMMAIFGEEGQKRNIANKIMQYLPIQVHEEDVLPIQVCMLCVKEIETWDSMVQRCVRANVKLQDLLNTENFSAQDQPECILSFDSEPTEEMDEDTTKVSHYPCIVEHCKGKFKTRVKLRQHYKSRHDFAFICQSCHHPFPTAEDLKEHKLAKHAEWNLCDLCGAVVTKKGLREHMVKHIPGAERKYRCSICNAGFNRRYLLKLHKTRHLVEKPLKCSKCSKTFFDESDLKKHILIHANKNSFKCDLCPDTFSCRRYLVGHKIRCHSAEWIYKCNVCSVHSPTLQDIVVHLEEEHEVPAIREPLLFHFTRESNYQCTTCCRYFPNKFSLGVHLSKFKNRKCKDIATKELNLEQCNICNEFVIGGRELFQHKLKHTNYPSEANKNSYSCEYCAREFKFRSTFITHLRTHTGERAFKCQYCPSTFTSKLAVRAHECEHRGETPFACKLCPLAFTSSLQCRRHTLNHTKPLQCSFCSRRFALKYQVVLHERTHTNERPFQCKFCTKAFKQKGDLEFHQLRHTKEKKFRCGNCDFSDNKLKKVQEHVGAEHPGSISIVVKHNFSGE